MSTILKQKGYNYCFDAKACEACKGNCCIGESGYIWVTPVELTAIANFLGISKEQFIATYLFKVGYRFSLLEKQYDQGHACTFFDLEHRQCTIYEVRPSQCRTFPFWDYFKTHYEELETECPGILPLSS